MLSRVKYSRSSPRVEAKVELVGRPKRDLEDTAVVQAALVARFSIKAAIRKSTMGTRVTNLSSSSSQVVRMLKISTV